MTAVEALRAFPGMDALEPQARVLLDRAAVTIALPAGAVPFRPGSPCDGYLFVLSGRIRVQLLSESGREIVLYRVEPNQTCILTSACLLGGSAYPAEAVAETPVEAALLPAAAFNELLARSAAFRALVFADFGRRLAALMTVIDDVAFSRVQSRLARFLLDSQDDAGRLMLSHQQIAAELGSAREVVSRQLKAFERRGWLRLDRRRIEVVDAAALRAVADGRPSPEPDQLS